MAMNSNHQARGLDASLRTCLKDSIYDRTIKQFNQFLLLKMAEALSLVSCKPNATKLVAEPDQNGGSLQTLKL
jgi:hypothetical protein